MALNLPQEPGSDKLFWVDGYWTDPRWKKVILLPKEEGNKLVNEISANWKDLSWVEQTEWFKEKMAAGEIDLRHLKASRKSRK